MYGTRRALVWFGLFWMRPFVGSTSMNGVIPYLRYVSYFGREYFTKLLIGFMTLSAYLPEIQKYSQRSRKPSMDLKSESVIPMLVAYCGTIKRHSGRHIGLHAGRHIRTRIRGRFTEQPIKFCCSQPQLVFLRQVVNRARFSLPHSATQCLHIQIGMFRWDQHHSNQL